MFSLFLDLDELPLLDERSRWFGYNRPAVFSFFDADHGDGGPGLRAWVEATLNQAGLTARGGSVRVLCYPRVLGYVFNPLSVFFCSDASGKLVALLHEVANTHGERHTYVIAANPDADGNIRQSCRKEFYVSPFLDMDCTYRFRVTPPGETATISIVESDGAGVILSAVFSGRRRAFSSWALAAAFGRYPLLTLKVVAGIHVQALRLWLKGIPVVDHRPAAKRFATSVVHVSRTNET